MSMYIRCTQYLVLGIQGCYLGFMLVIHLSHFFSKLLCLELPPLFLLLTATLEAIHHALQLVVPLLKVLQLLAGYIQLLVSQRGSRVYLIY